MGFWDKIRKDAERGIQDGIKAVKLKAGELTDEGKRKFRLFELKNLVHREMADLGGAVYALSSQAGNPLQSAAVKTIVERISKLEAEVTALETGAATKKKAAPKAARKKAAPKKAAPRRKAAPRKKAAPKS